MPSTAEVQGARSGALLGRLADRVAGLPGLTDALRESADGVRAQSVKAPASLRPFVAHALAGRAGPVLVVTATAREADAAAAVLAETLGPDAVASFPAWETLPHERLSPRSDTVGQRLATLRRLVHPESSEAGTPLRAVVAPVRSILQPHVRGLADLKPVELSVGDDHELDALVRDLAGAAYARVDLVERRGEFAVRGGIVDVFPPTADHPVRIEFWGDTVEEIRQFSVADQRSLEPVPRVWAPPCRELLLTDDVRARAKALAESHPSLVEMLTKISEGHAVEGMESFTPVLVDEMELLVDLLPEHASVLLCDPERVRARAHDLVATSEEFLQASWPRRPPAPKRRST